MPQMSKVELYAAIRRDHGASVSYQQVLRYVADRKSQILVESGKAPLEAFVPQTHQPGMEAEVDFGDVTVNTLASCEWIKKGQPLCLVGDSGTGKSHMLIALGTEAAMTGYRVRYTPASTS